jgi:hypothetical protein
MKEHNPVELVSFAEDIPDVDQAVVVMRKP